LRLPQPQAVDNARIACLLLPASIWFAIRVTVVGMVR
jgi:hypothetical protein